MMVAYHCHGELEKHEEREGGEDDVGGERSVGDDGCYCEGAECDADGDELPQSVVTCLSISINTNVTNRTKLDVRQQSRSSSEASVLGRSSPSKSSQ